MNSLVEVLLVLAALAVAVQGFGVPAHNVVSIGRTAIGYKPSRSMRNVNPYAKFDGSAPQNFRAYSNVAAFRAPVYTQSVYPSRRGISSNSLSYAPNPTLRREPSRFNFGAPRSQRDFTSFQA